MYGYRARPEVSESRDRAKEPQEVGVKMATIYLVRHGIKERTIGDVPLSKEGIVQAGLTATFFASKPIKHVYASPLRRATETASFIGSRLGLPVVVDMRLRERVNWGDLPGQTFEEFVGMWDQCSQDRHYVPPVGDSAQQAGERLEIFVRDVSSVNPSDDVIAVTHGGLITDFLMSVIPLDELRQWHPKFEDVHTQLVPECSVTQIEYFAGEFSVIHFADTDHL